MANPLRAVPIAIPIYIHQNKHRSAPKLPQNRAPLVNFVKLTLPRDENLHENAEANIDIPQEKDPFLKKL
ncbi:hypothetical protein WN944_014167 [Citrus x changshan-huyou]|uniref:Uncharacterized protein n=1 Tax=Citrus x changshan-huyou TaxID=2935761 RepID=A0AAP0QLF8_9ROSI